jgi:hypothetical protein
MKDGGWGMKDETKGQRSEGVSRSLFLSLLSPLFAPPFPLSVPLPPFFPSPSHSFKK